MNRHRGRLAWLVLLVVLVALPLQAEKKEHVASYKAIAIDVDGGAGSWIDIEILEWSSPEDRQALVDAFNEGGSEGVFEYLQKQDEVAFFKFPNTMGYDMGYAYKFDKGEKEQIFLASDRIIGAREVSRNTRSRDYDITMVYLEVDKGTGKGSGKLIIGAQVHAKDGQLQIETASQNPTQLNEVQQMKPKIGKN